MAIVRIFIGVIFADLSSSPDITLDLDEFIGSFLRALRSECENNIREYEGKFAAIREQSALRSLLFC